MTHDLKIWSEHYYRVKDGTKTFEIRTNDRAFQKGDVVCLRMHSMEGHALGGFDMLTFEIGDVYPIDAERVVFSLLRKPAPDIEK